MKRVAILKLVKKRELVFRRNVHEDNLSCAKSRYVGYVQCNSKHNNKYLGHKLFHGNSEEAVNRKIDKFVDYMIEKNSKDHYEFRLRIEYDEADLNSLPW